MENNVVEYLDTNLDVDNLINNIGQLPVSQPTFTAPQPQQQQPRTQPPYQYQQPPQQYQQPLAQPDNVSQEQMMMMQNITDARQLPGAEIITSQSAPNVKPSSAVLYNGQLFPLIFFKEEVLQQMQQMQMERLPPVPPPTPMIPSTSVIPPPPVVEPMITPTLKPNQSLIDLTVKEDSENLTSHSRGVIVQSIEEVDEKVSIIKQIFGGYKQSILVLLLTVLIMYNGLDKIIIEKVAFLDNHLIMLACKALLITIIYHIIAIFIKN
jgi:hypothetical protein